MTAQNNYPSSSGSPGRGIVLVVVALALGVLLLARGFDGDDDATDTASTDTSSTAPDDEPDEADEDSESPVVEGEPPPETSVAPTTVPAVVTRPPEQVRVVTINGTGVTGRAGRTADELNVEGYVIAAKNSEQSRVERSVIYFAPGYAGDAAEVARILGVEADIFEQAPATIESLIQNPDTPANLGDFNVFVLIGTDEAIPDPGAAVG